MMYGGGKSDPALVVAGKLANKAEASAAEPGKPRTGNVGQQSPRQAQDRETVSQALDRIRQVAKKPAIRRQTPEVRAVCIKVHVRICAGGVRQLTSLPRPNETPTRRPA
jgi:hypothetical protein